MDKVDKLLSIESDMARLRILLGEEKIDRTEFNLRLQQLHDEYTFVKAQEERKDDEG